MDGSTTRAPHPNRHKEEITMLEETGEDRGTEIMMEEAGQVMWGEHLEIKPIGDKVATGGKVLLEVHQVQGQTGQKWKTTSGLTV